MIRYALVCDKAHEFEGWFKNAAEFDRQLARKRLECPECGSAKIGKALMAPAVAGAAPAPSTEVVPVAAPDPRKAAVVEALREMRRLVTENADYVGNRFPEEARKIHYKEAEPRGIYGEATLEEAKGLAEEGIGFHPLPVLPEDRN
jgi:hypothetical protein